MTFNLKNHLNKIASTGVTEVQLKGQRKDKELLVTTQKQLDSQRKDKEVAKVTEGQLSKVRKASAPVAVKTAKDVSITEQQLRDGKDTEAPNSITEKQVDADHKETPNSSIEDRLEKVRTGAAGTLTEHRLDNSKSKIVKHRNAEASAGDINKLEEQRLANKPVEKEVAKPASEGRTLSDLSKGKKDTARLASSSLDFPIQKKKVTAGSDDDFFEEQFGQEGIAGLMERGKGGPLAFDPTEDFGELETKRPGQQDDEVERLTPEQQAALDKFKDVEPADGLPENIRQELERQQGPVEESKNSAVDKAFSFEKVPDPTKNTIDCVIRFDAAQVQAAGFLTPNDVQASQAMAANPEGRKRPLQSKGAQNLRQFAFEWMKNNLKATVNAELPSKELKNLDLSQVVIGADGKLSGFGRFTYRYNIPGQATYQTVRNLSGLQKDDELIKRHFGQPTFTPSTPVSQQSSDGSTISRGKAEFDLFKFYDIDLTEEEYRHPTLEEDIAENEQQGKFNVQREIDVSGVKSSALRWIVENVPSLVDSQGKVLISENDLEIVDAKGNPIPVNGDKVDLNRLKKLYGNQVGKNPQNNFPTMNVYVLYPLPGTQQAAAPQDDMMDAVSAGINFPMMIKLT